MCKVNGVTGITIFHFTELQKSPNKDKEDESKISTLQDQE